MHDNVCSMNLSRLLLGINATSSKEPHISHRCICMYKYPKFKWIRGKEEGRIEMEVRKGGTTFFLCVTIHRTRRQAVQHKIYGSPLSGFYI